MFRFLSLTIFWAMILSSIAVKTVESLSFVTAIANPMAALRAVNPVKVFTLSTSRLSANNEAFSSALDIPNPDTEDGIALYSSSHSSAPAAFEFGHDDETIQRHRNQIVDLVYSRSLDRMNQFLDESQ